MKEKYNALFDKIVPQKSDEELLFAVLDRKAVNMSEKKHFNKKAVIIPAAAAAVLLCTTVGVAAAYEWNLPAAISDIFGKDAEKIPDGVSFKEFNFNTVGGKELNDVFKFEGCEVQLKGVAADPHSVLVFYDVVFDNAVSEESMESFHVMNYGTDFQLFMDYKRNLNAAGTPDDPVLSEEWSWKHIQMAVQQHKLYLGSEGNVAHYCLKRAVSGPSLSGRSVTLEIGRLNSSSEYQEYVFDLDFVDDSNYLDIYKDNEISLSTGIKGIVSHIQLTPFSVCFRVDWGEQPVEVPDENGSISENALNVNDIYNEFKIKLKDGTIMDAKAFRPFEDAAGRTPYSKYAEEGAITDENGNRIGGNMLFAQDPVFEWLYPVNVADVEALIIGTTTVPVNQ